MLPSLLTRPDLERISGEARALVFAPRTRPDVHIDENDGGYPFVVITTPHAYRPGPSPDITLDATRLQSVLMSEGLTKVSLSYCAPLVPFEIEASPEPDSREGRCAHWDNLGTRALIARMTMHPSPAKFWGEVRWLSLVFLVDAAALLLVLRKAAWTTRRKVTLTLLGAVALGICAIAVSSVKTVQADNLGVRGQLSGPLLTLAQGMPALVLPLGGAAVVLMVLAWRTGRLRRRPIGLEPTPATPPDPWAA